MCKQQSAYIGNYEINSNKASIHQLKSTQNCVQIKSHNLFFVLTNARVSFYTNFFFFFLNFLY